MARVLRTAKQLAQRIELNYFKQPTGFRRWRRLLSEALILAGVVWLGWAALARNQQPYSSGPMSPVHAVFGNQCAACHLVEASAFRRHTTDQACLACHDGPIHHASQTYTPSCADCHVEHRGHVPLAHVRDAACTQCHADLQTSSGAPHYVRTIASFADHPEFAALRTGFRDPGTIKLNHFVHMKKDLRGPDGKPVQLVCADCHRPAAVQAAWRFGAANAPPAASPTAPGDLPAHALVRAYMAPPTYAQTCIRCHPLGYDARFAESVPHDTPEVIHAFLVKRFTEYIALHPAELRETKLPPWLAERPLPAAVRILTPPEWVREHVAESEELLWKKTCKECHALTTAAEPALPSVAPSRITPRWLPHSVFDHEAHRMLACTACHIAAVSSQETSDVLIPGIATCRACHHAGTDAAEAGCFECHAYHDWSRRKERQANYSIPFLLKQPAPVASGGSTR